MIKKAYLYLFIVILFFSIALTAYITKSIYDIDVIIPKPEIITQKVTTDIPQVIAGGKISKEIVQVPIFVYRDSTKIVIDTQSVKVTTASIDTAVQFQTQVSYKDTTFTAYDTLQIGIKYFYEPINKFSFKATIKRSNHIYHEYKAIPIERKETFFDRFSLGIGFGYSTHLEAVNFKPSIFIGIIYNIRLSIL